MKKNKILSSVLFLLVSNAILLHHINFVTFVFFCSIPLFLFLLSTLCCASAFLLLFQSKEKQNSVGYMEMGKTVGVSLHMLYLGGAMDK